MADEKKDKPHKEHKDGQHQHKEKPPKKDKKPAPEQAAAEKAPEKPAVPEPPAAPARLRVRYEQAVRPELMKELGFKNLMQAPKLEKIVVNMGLGEAINNGKIIDASVEQLGSITGQKPVVTKSRKSIANFKLRQGQSIGAMVTLRGDRMYEFFDRLVSIALPRVRDFKGVSPKAFDGKGNYTLGVREQIIFPEINYDKVEKIKGLNITVVTTARNDEEGRALLRHLGMPFRT
jgi:large subunit ribosomal protein L5